MRDAGHRDAERRDATLSFGFDSASQLTEDNGTTLAYDGAGNRTGGSYGVPPGNRMSADANWSYSYDSNGNDVYGTVLQLDADYIYDAFGNRIQKVVDNDGSGAGAPVTMQFA